MQNLRKSSPSAGNIAAPIFLSTDSKGIILRASDSLLLFLGKSRKETIGISLEDICDKTSAKKLANIFNHKSSDDLSPVSLTLIANNKQHKASFSISTKTGKTSKVSYQFEETQPPTNGTASEGDKELSTLCSFLHSNPQPVIVLSAGENELLFANNKFLELYEYSEEEIKSLSIADLENEQNQSSNERYAANSSFKTVHLTSAGKKIYVEVTATTIAVGNRQIQLIYINDVSAQHIHLQEQRLAGEINDAFKKGKTFRDSATKVVAKLRAYLGWDLGEFWLFSQENKFALIEAYSFVKEDQPISKFLHDSLTLRVSVEQIGKRYRDLKSFWVEDIEKDSTFIRSAEATAAGLKSAIVVPFGDNGQLLGGLFLFSKERKPVDNAILELLNNSVVELGEEINHRKNFEQLDTCFQLSGDGLCIADVNGRFTKVNQSFIKMLGFTEAELLGRSYFSFVHDDDKEKAASGAQKLLKNEKLYDFELRVKCKNDEYRLLSWSAVYSTDHQLLLGVARDITEMRKAQKEINQREEQYRTLTENVPLLIHKLDKDLKLIYINRAVELTFGQSASLLLGKTPGQLGMHSELWRMVEIKCADVFRSGTVHSFTLKLPSERAPGRVYNLLLTLAPEKDEGGNVNAIIVIANEISPIVHAQEALIYKDKLLSLITRITHNLLKDDNYRNTLDDALKNIGEGTSADRVYIFENRKDENGEVYCYHTYEWCSDKSAPQLNNPVFQAIPFSLLEDQFNESAQEDFCFSRLTENVTNETLKAFMQMTDVQSILMTPVFVDEELWGFVGIDDCHSPRIWSEVDKDIIKTFASCLASAIERRRSEENVLESEERFRNMADTAPVMIWVSDSNDRTTYVNKTWTEFTGINPSRIRDIVWNDIVHPDDAEIAITRFDEFFKQRLPVSLEYRMKTANGSFRWIIDQSIPRFLSDGTFLGYIGTVIDIHDRKIAEEKMSYQARVMQEITDAIIATDLNFNITTWNSGAEKIHGITAEKIIGKKVHEVFQYNYLAESREQVLDHLFNYGYWSGEIYYDRADQRRIYLFSSISFVTNNSGQRIGLVEVQRDITEKRKSEEALRISEERYRTVVDALSEGIILIDRQGNILTSNKSADSIIRINQGTSKGISIGDPSWTCVKEDFSPFPFSDFPAIKTLTTGESQHGVVMGFTKGSDPTTWVSINTEPLYYSVSRTNVPDAVVASLIDITQRKTAELELMRSEQQLREYSDRINSILDSITDGFIAADKHLKVFLWNKVLANITGITASEVVGKNIDDVFPGLDAKLIKRFTDTIGTRDTIVEEFYSNRFKTWFEITAFPSHQGLFLYFRDINHRKKQERLLALEKEVLELNARPQASLQYNTEVLLAGMESIFPGVLCSVLSLRDDGKTIETLAAPSLPTDFINAVNGLKIGPKDGSCGTAMYLKQNIIVDDIENNELWESYKGLALHFDLRACWSFPILSSQNKVLASLAIYNKMVKSPSKEELSVIERAVNLLRIIIENKQSEEKIKISNERYLLATMATNDAIWDWDVATNFMYWGEGFHGLFGYKAGSFANDLGRWESAIHPSDRDRVLQSLQVFIDSNSQQVWQEEYRFKKADGKYVLVADRGFLIYNQQGKVSRMVGSMQDITEKREMEKKLLRQELNKQKLVAQAVVDAQEKERSLIGKELHDNINQILSTAKLYLEVARNDEKERVSLIDMSTQGISDAINEIRTISRSLVPSSIGDLGLVESIQDLVESIKLTRKLNVEFYHHDGIDDLMSEAQKLMLFRITQEQVNNVMKHADAKNLIIELFAEDDMINISISDDGKGFDTEQVKQKKGVGLFNITSRAELFNGKVTINSSPGKGCILNIHVPFSNL